VLADIAWRLVGTRAWETLGYARLADYADERLGRSARSVQDLARVGAVFGRLPQLRAALAGGRLGWTKARLIARVATRDDVERWIAYARGVTAATLSREVRRVDRGSLEENGLERDRSLSRWFEVACTPEVRWRWGCARSFARQVHGGRLSLSGSAEMIAAEVLSALPPDPHSEQGDPDADQRPPTSLGEVMGSRGSRGDDPGLRDEPSPPDDECFPVPSAPAGLDELARSLERADPFELDRRLRVAVERERRLDARIGPLLEVVMGRRIHTMLGHATREGYVRERLGLEPSWGRALLRIERAARASPTYAAAYRRGALTALQARTLVPLVLSELCESRIAAWVERAGAFTLRRLTDDVEQALLVRETDPETWLRTGGLPEEAECREPSATGDPLREREIGANGGAPRETSRVRMIIDADVARLLRAVLCTVRRRIERVTGRLPTRGEARDGWRCVVPGCTSMRNLHDHHIRFRSAGGSDEPSNRVTLCAFHHLRGVHSGIVRCTGTAPDRLRIALGVRPGSSSLAVYGSGDRLLSPACSSEDLPVRR
jgi:hypothetical protein